MEKQPAPPRSFVSRLSGDVITGLCSCLVYIVAYASLTLLVRSQRSPVGDIDDEMGPTPSFSFSSPSSTATSSSALAFNPASVVAMTHTGKLVISVISLYMFHGQTPLAIVRNARKGVGFVIPAVLYSLYDNLAYVVMAMTEPVTWHALSNIKIAITALCVQLVFARSLGWRRWLCLMVLMVGCVVLEVDPWRLTLSHGLTFYMLLGTALMLSSTAGVVNELLLKQDMDLSLHLQNTYFYLCSAFINLATVAVKHALMAPTDAAPTDGQEDDMGVLALAGLAGNGTLSNGARPESDAYFALPFVREAASEFFRGWTVVTVMIMGCDIVGGLSVSFVLKYLGNIAKVLAGSVNMLVVALAGHLIFGTPLTFRLFSALFIIGGAVLLYNVLPAPTPPADDEVNV